MSTYKELVFMVLDELKGRSDDFTFTEDHIIYLLDKYRAALLNKVYGNIKKMIPNSNYQTICLSLDLVSTINGKLCDNDTYLRSTLKVPFLLNVGNPRVYPIDYYLGDITFITRDRMRYVGHNKFLSNIIYCSIGPDNYLYFKSCNPQHLYLKQVKFTGLFLEPSKAIELECSSSKLCDIIDNEFPIEEDLIPDLLLSVMKEILGPAWRPQDTINNGADDLSSLANFLLKNSKNDLLKALTDDGTI